MRLRMAMISLLASAGIAAAAQLSDYARQWPVSVAEEGAYALLLDESVYRQLARNDLADLAAFNADGMPLAFGPMPASYGPAPDEWREAAWFALPRGDDRGISAGDDLHLRVRRSADGELSLDADLGAGNKLAAASEAALVQDLLVDVKAGAYTVEAIAFETRPASADFNLQVAVDASEDLEHWRTVTDSATLAQLHQNGQQLARKLIEFAPLDTRYLRVRSLGAKGLPLASLRLQLRPKWPRPRMPPRQWITAGFVERDGPAFIYRMPARVPVEAVAVELANDNSLAELQVSVRDDTRAPWQYAGHLTAFRLRGAGLSLDNDPLVTTQTRATHWRVSTAGGQDLQQPPVLRLAYRPETWLLLTHGRPPYVIAAGSQRALRSEFPLEMLVGQVRGKYGPDWQPAAAHLGSMREAGGETALTAYDPAQKRTWLLWGVLALGALVVIVMVFKLLKSGSGDSTGA